MELTELGRTFPQFQAVVDYDTGPKGWIRNIQTYIFITFIFLYLVFVCLNHLIMSAIIKALISLPSANQEQSDRHYSRKKLILLE